MRLLMNCWLNYRVGPERSRIRPEPEFVPNLAKNFTILFNLERVKGSVKVDDVWHPAGSDASRRVYVVLLFLSNDINKCEYVWVRVWKLVSESWIVPLKAIICPNRALGGVAGMISL